jgi:anti-sigma B factor antagonist
VVDGWWLVVVSGAYPNKESPMQIVERSAGNVTILDLSGQITFTEGDQQFKDKVNSLVHQGRKNILVNLANVTYMDSAGLGELAGAYTTVTKAGGSMKLLNLTKRLHDLLSITKLLTIFDTFESEQDALKQFG